jgi:hypothetical protein
MAGEKEAHSEPPVPLSGVQAPENGAE